MDFLYGLLGFSVPSLTDTETNTDTETSMVPEDGTLFVLRFLQQNTRFFDLIGHPDTPHSHNSFLHKNKNIPFSLLKGCVQSGKSRIIHALCLYCTCILQTNILVIVRNFTDDYDQFRRGWDRFLLEYLEFLKESETSEDPDPDLPNMYYLGDVKRDKDGHLFNHEDMLEDLSSATNVLVALANTDQISKLNDCLDHLAEHDPQPKPLKIVIDEMDQIGYSLGDRFNPQLEYLLEYYGEAIFGISATLFEPLQSKKFGFQTDHVYYLTPPPAYKGITDISYHYIEPTDGNLLEDPDLDRFLQRHCTHEPFQIHHQEKHPMMALIKTERLITQQETLLRHLSMKYPREYTVITYNGTCCQLRSSCLSSQAKIVLPVCKKRGKNKNGTHTFKNTPLPYVLQYLKNNGGAAKFPRIIIIAYKLIGRGINIVSEDFGWHLTHMFYRPSPTTDVTNLIQSMRLCGIYRDNIPLQCFLPQKDYENLYRGYMLQEELLDRISSTEENRSLPTFVEGTVMYKDKIPRCKLSRNQKYMGKVTKEKSEDKGWSMERFHGKRCVAKMMTTPAGKKKGKEMDPKELHRLTNDKNGMFKKWANPNTTSAIARFMREGLDPDKEYTKKDLQNNWKQHGGREHISSLLSASIGKGKGYGTILEIFNHRYRLYPDLIPAYNKYF